MESAPPFDCADCGRRIGKTRSHWLMRDGGVWCGRCVDRKDAYDDVRSHGTRAGVAWRLGLWPHEPVSGALESETQG